MLLFYALKKKIILLIRHISTSLLLLIFIGSTQRVAAIVPVQDSAMLDQYKGISIFSNGPIISKSHGAHYNKEGYYFGQKWQCVEFVKRFYYLSKKHKMPNVWGHAKFYYFEKLKQGAYNQDRGLYQYQNGGNVQPALDDLIVFDGLKYGHVAIISDVKPNYIEVVQQNVDEKPRERYNVIHKNNQFYVIGSRKALGWLRKEIK